MRLPILICLACLLVSLPASAIGDGLPAPEGEVLLTVTGNITHANAGNQAHFDRELLRSLSPLKVCTRTPWHRETSCFRGPLVREVLAAVGAQGDSIVVQALNKFRAEIPVQELHDYDVILAMSRDGEPMPIRELGPLFVLYPFGDHPELHTEAVRFRSVWHVASIHVR